MIRESLSPLNYPCSRIVSEDVNIISVCSKHTEESHTDGQPIVAPTLDPKDDMGQFLSVDYATILSKLQEDGIKPPIFRNTKLATVESYLCLEPPLEGKSIEGVLEEILPAAEKFSRRNINPGVFGVLTSSGSAVDPLSHAMVGALNQNATGFISSPLAAAVEQTVIKWFIDLIGMPTELADGVLLSGGSIGNLTALATALSWRFGADYRANGIAGDLRGKPIVICSSDSHFSIKRAASMLGIGSNNVLEINTDSHDRMDIDLLEQCLLANKSAFCVVATAGTTASGAIDPLNEIAKLCQKFGVWFHVDAAYGGGALLCPELRDLFEGIEEADSVAMDLHKWFYSCFASSVLLYRNQTSPRQLFFSNSKYFRSDFDPCPENHMFFHLSPELSRPFRSLPIYMTIRHFGINTMGKNVLYNVECARYLAKLVQQHPDLQLWANPQLSIVNFRYFPKGASPEILDDLNEKICNELMEEGNFAVSIIILYKKLFLRFAILNNRTRASHVQNALTDILRIGNETFMGVDFKELC